MAEVRDEVLAANEAYAKGFGPKAQLPMPPARRFAILNCMDARLDPAKFVGLSKGDAHVIRNAGGRASDDAIRSLVISHKLLGTKEWFVIHHTDCGMETFTDEPSATRFGYLDEPSAMSHLSALGLASKPCSPADRRDLFKPRLVAGDGSQICFAGLLSCFTAGKPLTFTISCLP